MGERGASGLFILVVLVLVALAVLAVVALNRTTDSTADLQNSTASLAKAGAALEAYAGASGRLPCPANPAVDDGVEVTSGATDCQYTQGTLPWTTIGMRRDDAYDAWGHKLSYRVFTGGAGSLTQAGGVSMVNCDSVVDGGGASGTICQADHSTLAANFLSGKGLTVIDFGVNHGDTAYVVLSHGPTGLGAYTSSGVQLNLPNGDEKDNTKDTGPFHVEAFSASNTSATDPSHFDDLLYYRSITAVVNATGLAARAWSGALSAVTLDKDTLAAALGSNPRSDTGATTIAFTNVTVSAFNSGGSEDISFVHGGGANDGIGGVNGGTNLVTSGGEGLQLNFTTNARQFAFTVDNFKSLGVSAEQLELRFYEVVGATATLQGSPVTRQSCATDNQSESFSVDPGATFNRVEIRPLPATGGGVSDFSLSEIRSCAASVTCQTALAASGHSCP